MFDMQRSRHNRHDKKRRAERSPGQRPGQSKRFIRRPLQDQIDRLAPSLPSPTGHYGRELAKLLSGIGAPPRSPFKPDRFQLEALSALEIEDVLVTAPTGSGKTWIAREEIHRLLKLGKRAWYTTPLKALTNSKYQEFSDEFGSENVGILTGDRKENSNAPLIVGTTEIYRNQLFNALRGGEAVAADLVVICCCRRRSEMQANSLRGLQKYAAFAAAW